MRLTKSDKEAFVRSLMFFCRVCRERLAPGAQQETREVAEQIAEIVAPLFPVSWSALMESAR